MNALALTMGLALVVQACTCGEAIPSVPLNISSPEPGEYRADAFVRVDGKEISLRLDTGAPTFGFVKVGST